MFIKNKQTKKKPTHFKQHINSSREKNGESQKCFS